MRIKIESLLYSEEEDFKRKRQEEKHAMSHILKVKCTSLRIIIDLIIAHDPWDGKNFLCQEFTKVIFMVANQMLRSSQAEENCCSLLLALHLTSQDILLMNVEVRLSCIS